MMLLAVSALCNLLVAIVEILLYWYISFFFAEPELGSKLYPHPQMELDFSLALRLSWVSARFSRPSLLPA